MSDKPGIVVTGASGRMGQTLVKLILASDHWQLVGCIERAGSPWLGRDIGEALGTGVFGQIITDDPLPSFARARAVVDFTSPEASVNFAKLAAQARLVHVVGTTGLAPDHHRALDLAAQQEPEERKGGNGPQNNQQPPPETAGGAGRRQPGRHGARYR